MDAYTWWYSHLRRYNFWVAISGVSAAAASALIVSAFPEALPGAEITIFAILFQAAAYLAVMGIVNLIMVLLGPFLERRIRPVSKEAFRKRLFSLAFWASCLAPYLIPLILLIKAIGSPAAPSAFEGY